MGRELKRVALDFDWPIDKVWEGYVNPLYRARPCSICGGNGLSATGKHLHDLWYGHTPFRPEDRGSIPFRPDDSPVRTFAERQCAYTPEYYGTGERAVVREAERLCRHWNASWSHHLNDADVAALVAADRLYDFTRTWTRENDWVRKDPPYVPTAREVNEWSLGGMGHDSINQWVCLKAECRRLGESESCPACDGAGDVWPSEEAEAAYEAWRPTPPPAGDGYQIWETVSEGSPISPVFPTQELLAAYMTNRKWGADSGSSYETWLRFINGPGWAPSMIGTERGIVSGVEAVAGEVPMTDYPQHDAVRALNGANQTVGDFIEWLGQNGMAICVRHKPAMDNNWHEYWPTSTTRDSLIAEFFGIDERELSREKDRMLEEFRRRQDEERMTG